MGHGGWENGPERMTMASQNQTQVVNFHDGFRDGMDTTLLGESDLTPVTRAPVMVGKQFRHGDGHSHEERSSRT